MSHGMVEALLHEREGYKAARMWDRMRQVDVELARYGVAVEDETPEVKVSDAPETAVARRPGRPRKSV